MKLLIALSRFPYPLEKGDKLRAYHQIKYLSQYFDICLFAISDQLVEEKDQKELEKYCSKIKIYRLSKFQIFGNLARVIGNGLPFQVSYFYNQKIQKSFDDCIQAFQPDAIYCQLIRTAPLIFNHPKILKTLDYMDVFSKGMERRGRTSAFYLKPMIRWEYQKLLNYERKVFDAFDLHTIISEQDREWIPHPHKKEIEVIPNGVDFEFFYPQNQECQFDILFNGNMNYPPNIESAVYLIEEIMPFVWKERPDTKVLISGASPHARVRDLQSDRVVVSGWVDDIRDSYAQSRILVAPMLISIGLQNKLLEAMAMKVPCITSSLANNALKAKAEVEILEANEPIVYAKHILHLLENPDQAAEMADRAYDFVQKNYGWAASTLQLSKLVSGIKT